MKVKIIKSKNELYWYTKLIGEIIEVEDVSLYYLEGVYRVTQYKKGNTYYIYKEDVLIMDREKKLKRILNEDN